MALGADKAIAYDPPGAIGIFDRTARFQIRFPETVATARPQDVNKVCDDFDVVAADATTMPTLIDGTTGRARFFDGLAAGVGALDKISGATLMTRDTSIQVIVSWNAVGQTDTGVIISRGGDGVTPSGYTSFALCLEPGNPATFTTEVKWLWQDLSGNIRLQAGPEVVILPNTWTMLTATRRWVSATEVVLRYYVGDLLLGEFISIDGDIGGGTTGMMRLGYATLGLATQRFHSGGLNEALIVDRELTFEEIEATWLRMTVYQKRGETLYKEMMDEGFPLSDDPGSDAQRDIRLKGQALGFASALAENLRANFLPGRAYGSTLEQWEEVLRPTPQPNQDIDTRRARLLARMRQRRGISIPGLEDALVSLIGDAELTDLQFIAFDNTVRDDFAVLDPARWDVQPPGIWSSVSGAAHAGLGAGTHLFDGVTQDWKIAQMSSGGDSRQAHVLAKVTLPVPQVGLEAGLLFADHLEQNFILLGLRNLGATTDIIVERFVNRVSSGAAGIDSIVGNPANLWLHLFQTDVDGTWKAGFSTTSGTTGFTLSPDLAHPTVAHWAGMYARTIGAIAATGQVDVDDLILRTPFGTRPFNAYVLLDDALGFSPDILAAQSVVGAIKHGYTHATFITSRDLLCDDIESGCDLGCMGGI